MEQATNQFTGGLLLDTHPMVTGNNVMTDCLNGTITTMAGNEVILLNDMGNRRVDNAFLPPGYQPVGMKEYGGVIYVAAYNPITNKSLIGSFPSPEKKINSLDDPNLANTFDFSSFSGESNTEEDSYLDNLRVLKSDTFMIPLTGDVNLRAGDKFAIYSSSLYNLKDDITNYKNTSESKINSPKNKKYTLSIGILNSLNEFVDITKTLCRWNDSNKIIAYNNGESDLYKFNDGYFISKDFADKDFFETINDSKLIKERQKMAANTYAYKLIGPMYLKVVYNHIENFNYNIYGIKNKNNCSLWIEGYLTYNCPDGVNNSDGNDIYNSLGEGLPVSNVLNGFDFKVNTSTLIPTSITYEKCKYNSISNSYTVKVVKEYTVAATSGTINYIIGVNSGLQYNNESIYLKGLSVKGSLNLDLLGSGTVAINGWRFYNNTEKTSTTLTFSFNAYPKYGESFNNLRFFLKDITTGLIEEEFDELTGELKELYKTFIKDLLSNNNDNNKLFYPFNWDGVNGLPLYNGRQTYNINWEGYLLPRKIYQIIIGYDRINSSNNSFIDTEVINDERWLITTDLFNDFYSDTSIKDFCLTENSVFMDKMKVNLYSDNKIENNSKYSFEFEGGLTSLTSSITYLGNHKYTLNLVDKSKLFILNEELYPDFILFDTGGEESLEINNILVDLIGNIKVITENHTNNTNYTSEFSNAISFFNGTECTSNTSEAFDNIELLKIDTSIAGNTISGEISFKDALTASGDKVTHIQNGFNKLSNIIIKASPLKIRGDVGVSIETYSCGGIIVNFDEASEETDYLQAMHYVEVAKRLNTAILTSLLPDDELGENYERIWKKAGNSELKVNFSFISDNVYEALNNSLFTSSQMFLFIFLSTNPEKEQFFSRTHNSDWDHNSDTQFAGNHTRVWWRTSRNDWATFKDLFELLTIVSNNDNTSLVEQFKRFIINHLSHDYIYCMYNDYSSDNLLLYATKDDYKRTNEFFIPLTLLPIYSLSDSIENIITNLEKNELNYTYYTIGNLSFKAGTLVNENINTVAFDLKSAKKFYDQINKFDIDNISNVEINTGLMLDSSNNILDPLYVYYLDTSGQNNKLIKLSNHYFKVDFENTIEGANTLVYNRQQYSRPNYSYQITSKNERVATVLDYNNVNVISDD